MDATKLSFLKATLGDEAATALNKAVERYEPLEAVLVPRVIISWLNVTARTGYEGEIPGVAGSHLSFTKNEDTDLFAGLLAVNGVVHPFENASVMHLVAGVSVALKADVSADHGIRDSDLVNLGRQVDLLAKAAFVTEFEPLVKGAMKRVAPFNPAQVSNWTKASTNRWTAEERNRDQVEPLEDEARVRALHKLTGATQVKRHPQTGERMFLLHRGMGGDEHKKVTANPGFITHDQMSSWTPRHQEAAAHGGGYAAEEGGDVTYFNTVSAWVPERAIHSVPKQLGDTNEYARPGPNQYSDEYEVLVAPHQSERAETPPPPVGMRGPANARLQEQRATQQHNAQIDDVMAMFKDELVVPPVAPKRKTKTKKFNFRKSQLDVECTDCGGKQIEKGKFVGCLCTSELARYASLSKSTNGYSIEFGPEWGEDELSLLFTIIGEANAS